MTLKISYEHKMPYGALHNRVVISHLRSVLNTYVNNPNFSKYYIGITSDLETRRIAHQRKKPFFKLMCPIYEESHPKSDIAFHGLEREAIKEFRHGIKNPSNPNHTMICGNGPAGSPPKNCLYVLLG